MEYFWPLFWGVVVVAISLAWIFADPQDFD